ncbi:hypothetical protein C8D78_1952 [Arthrobacter oryzae]|uniref:Uncharacterized protein n=1 Tax=Arthrobacter oryzae TaxID=409290 RepID=A0A495EVJ6_9MICC|nr:hypothetical protein C8D78_1952 [Arthrobacter oryzae]
MCPSDARGLPSDPTDRTAVAQSGCAPRTQLCPVRPAHPDVSFRPNGPYRRGAVGMCPSDSAPPGPPDAALHDPPNAAGETPQKSIGAAPRRTCDPPLARWGDGGSAPPASVSQGPTGASGGSQSRSAPDGDAGRSAAEMDPSGRSESLAPSGPSTAQPTNIRRRPRGTVRLLSEGPLNFGATASGPRGAFARESGDIGPSPTAPTVGGPGRAARRSVAFPLCRCLGSRAARPTPAPGFAAGGHGQRPVGALRRILGCVTQHLLGQTSAAVCQFVVPVGPPLVVRSRAGSGTRNGQ